VTGHARCIDCAREGKLYGLQQPLALEELLQCGETHYDDATWVGYRLAELLPLPLSIKQSMLEVSDANVRLAALAQFLERQGLLQAL
jgi:Lon protease-like protein